MQHETMSPETATEARAIVTLGAAEFANAAKLLAGKVVERRNTIPVLSAILIEVQPCGRVTLTGTDLDIMARIELQADPSEAIEPGRLCLNAGALSDALAKARRGADRVRLTQTDSDRATLKASRGNWSLRGHDAETFPILAFAGDTDIAAPIPAAQFLADLKALAPAVSTEESRYYLNGYAMQARDMAGRDSLVMVATDGSNMAVASRPMPEGLAGWDDAILPRKAGAVTLAAAKLYDAGETLTLSRFGNDSAGKAGVAFGPVLILSKLIDGTFPQWPVTFERVAAPTDGVEPPLFPELLPGAPVADMEKLGKAAPGAIKWELGKAGFIGCDASDPGLAYVCARGALHSTGQRNFSHNVGGHDEAAAYLKAIAEGLGLPSDGEMQARVDAINEAWGEPDIHVYNRDRAFGEAAMVGEYVGGRQPVQGRNGLVTKCDRILGYTVGAFHLRRGWTESRPNWETLVNDVIEHPETVEAVEGSYSVLMPDHGPQLEVRPDHYVDAADGNRYPIADNGSKIHLSADQLRALIGDSLWEVIELASDNGKPRYVSAWCYEQGDSRLLCVGKDGRCPKADAPREYVTRAEVEAALAGDVAAPVETVAMIEAPQAVAAPESREDCAEAPCASHAAVMPESAPIAAPVAAEMGKRTDAERRAIIRAWQMRAAMRRMRAEARQKPEDCAATVSAPDAPATVPDAILSDLAAAEALMRGASYVPPADDTLREGLRIILHRGSYEGLCATVYSNGAGYGWGAVTDCGRHVSIASYGTPDRGWSLCPTVDEAEPTPSAIQRRERAPAHERAIRRTWAERKARRKADARIDELERAMLNACNGSRDLAGALQRTQTQLAAAQDQARLAESIAEDHLRMREDVQRILAATERRAEDAEAENAQLWAEIETLTAPVEALAA